MANGDPRPARVPGGAPAELRRFVACEVDRVELSLADMGWLPKPEALEAAPTPTVSIADGWTSTSATISVGYGFVSIELPASVVDGQLRIDSSNLGFGIGDGIDKWVEAFNRTLAANGKQLEGIDVRGERIALTKQALVPATEDAPSTGTAPAPVTRPDDSAEEEPKRPPGGCAAWLLGGVAALAAAIGLTVALSGGGDDGTTEATGPTPPPAAAPADEADPTPTPPVGDETDDDAAGVAPGSDVGRLDETDGAGADSTRTCGTAPGEFRDGPWERFEDAGACSPGPDSYANNTCDPVFLPCSDGTNIILTVPGTMAGIDHQRSVEDALTGQIGASLARLAAFVLLFPADPAAIFQVSSECGGNLLTGQAPVATDDVTIVEQPLLSFGPCTIVDAAILQTSPDGEPYRRTVPELLDRSFEVGPAESDPDLPDTEALVATSSRFQVRTDWAAASTTVTNTIGASTLTDDCFWFFAPENTELLVKVLDGCSFGDHFWVFYGALTDIEVTLTVEDTVLAHGGAFANPLGQPAPPVFDTRGFDTSGPLFDNTVFPCGYGDVGYTACPAGAPPVDAGAFVVVSAAMVDTVSIEGDGTQREHAVDFGPAGGPRYSMAQHEDGWTVSSSTGATRARAIFRDNAVTLVVPQDELPEGELTYVWETNIDGVVAAQPSVPVQGLITTPALIADDDPPAADAEPDPAGPEPTESLEEFYAALSASIAAGDLGFALDRLDPLVIEAYADQCPAALTSFADPDFSVDVIEQTEVGPWTWQLPDGRTFEVGESITVRIVVSGRGQSGIETEAHLTVVDGQYRWFTFCA